MSVCPSVSPSVGPIAFSYRGNSEHHPAVSYFFVASLQIRSAVCKTARQTHLLTGQSRLKKHSTFRIPFCSSSKVSRVRLTILWPSHVQRASGPYHDLLTLTATPTVKGANGKCVIVDKDDKSKWRSLSLLSMRPRKKFMAILSF